MENLTVICNNCNESFNEDDLALIEFDINDDQATPTAIETNFNVVRITEEPKEKDFLKGCPNCHTDNYLMNKS